MHIKHIHETMEKLSKYACDEACKSVEEIDTKELGEVVDMISDLAEAEYHARIAKAMEESEKEDEEEAKRIMREMKEQYGDEEGERRFYDNYRYANGRFAPKGRGTRRRGYAEPMYHMPMDYDYDRDVDRMMGNRMYYSGGGSNGGRYDRAKRGYQEKKEINKGNTPEENSENMRGLEELLAIVGGDVKELMPKMSASEKQMASQKFDMWSKMMKQ